MAEKKTTKKYGSKSFGGTTGRKFQRRAIQPVCVGSGDKLMLLESPNKVQSVKKYLGAGWRIMATYGHCIKLKERGTGIDTTTWVGEFEVDPDKQVVVDAIKTEVKTAKEVYLATDPDREGEAIAWFIWDAVKAANPKAKFFRATFNAITKQAVNAAIQTKNSVNMNMVYSQRTRAFMDRLVGYTISPILRQNLTGSIYPSAGRVQSVALRVLSERQREIEAFVPKEYWELFVNTTVAHTPVKFLFYGKAGKKIEVTTEQQSNQILNDVEQGIKKAGIKILDIKETDITRNPKPPFTTATLQQAASTMLGFSVSKTMTVAQELFQGAFITYHRSDSVRLEDEQIKSAQAVLKNDFGTNYVSPTPVIYKSKSRSKVQDAHTAIQPTDPAVDKIASTPDGQKLYDLVRKRFLACQATPCKLRSKSVTIEAGGYEFRTSGSTILFDGFRKIWGIDEEDDENTTKLPAIDKNDKPTFISLEKNQKFTSPPAYYNDASLVKTLEANGVGRPSTYASILDTLKDKSYVTQEGKKLVVTQFGYDANDYLVKNFPDFFNMGFTALMEDKLDKIEDGQESWTKTLDLFWADLSQKTAQAKKSQTQNTGKVCHLCGAEVQWRTGFRGAYYKCSNASCAAKFDKEGNPKAPAVEVGICVHCGKAVVERNGRYGVFFACSGFPACRTIYLMQDGVLVEKKPTAK